jgi:hypothetical protein
VRLNSWALVRCRALFCNDGPTIPRVPANAELGAKARKKSRLAAADAPCITFVSQWHFLVSGLDPLRSLF